MDKNILLLANFDSVNQSIRLYKNPDSVGDKKKETIKIVYQENNKKWQRLINTFKLMYLINQPIAFMDNMLIDSGMFRFSCQTHGNFMDEFEKIFNLASNAGLVNYIYDNRIKSMKKETLVQDRIDITLKNKNFYRSASYYDENDWVTIENYNELIKTYKEEKIHLGRIQGLVDNIQSHNIYKNSTDYTIFGISENKSLKFIKNNINTDCSSVKNFVEYIFGNTLDNLTRSDIYFKIDKIVNNNPSAKDLGQSIKKILVDITYNNQIKYSMENSVSENSPHQLVEIINLNTFFPLYSDDKKYLQNIFINIENNELLKNIFGVNVIQNFDSKNELEGIIGRFTIEEIEEISLSIKSKIRKIETTNKKQSRIIMRNIFNKNNSKVKLFYIIFSIIASYIFAKMVNVILNIVSFIYAKIVNVTLKPQPDNYLELIVGFIFFTIVLIIGMFTQFKILLPTKWKKLKEDINEILNCSKPTS